MSIKYIHISQFRLVTDVFYNGLMQKLILVKARWGRTLKYQNKPYFYCIKTLKKVWILSN